MIRRAVAAAVSAAMIAPITIGDDWRPPEVATTRKAFEAAYAKTTVSGAALELESLAAFLGIDVAPRGREHPDPETAERAQGPVAALGRYLDKELAEPSERIGPPPQPGAEFLKANASTLDSMTAVLSGRREMAWGLDVSAGVEAPVPNTLGLLKLQRVLGARALVMIRDAQMDAALTTLEGMWRLCQSLARRPELISHIAVIAQARAVVGVLRKSEGPAFGWPERMRERGLVDAFLAAFQNDPWPAASEPEMAGHVEILTRIYRRFADGLLAKSACDWTREELAHSWDVAVSGETDPGEMVMTINSETIIDMVLRSHRFLLDAELTALVIEARIDRYASRGGEWPATLLNLESSVCPGQFYTYSRSGGVTLAFAGNSPSGDLRGLVLPLSFKGAPPPTRTPTATPSTPSTPTPGSTPQAAQFLNE